MKTDNCTNANQEKVISEDHFSPKTSTKTSQNDDEKQNLNKYSLQTNSCEYTPQKRTSTTNLLEFFRGPAVVTSRTSQNLSRSNSVKTLQVSKLNDDVTNDDSFEKNGIIQKINSDEKYINLDEHYITCNEKNSIENEKYINTIENTNENFDSAQENCVEINKKFVSSNDNFSSFNEANSSSHENYKSADYYCTQADFPEKRTQSSYKLKNYSFEQIKLKQYESESFLTDKNVKILSKFSVISDGGQNEINTLNVKIDEFNTITSFETFNEELESKTGLGAVKNKEFDIKSKKFNACGKLNEKDSKAKIKSLNTEVEDFCLKTVEGGILSTSTREFYEGREEFNETSELKETSKASQEGNEKQNKETGELIKRSERVNANTNSENLNEEKPEARQKSFDQNVKMKKSSPSKVEKNAESKTNRSQSPHTNKRDVHYQSKECSPRNNNASKQSPKSPRVKETLKGRYNQVLYLRDEFNSCQNSDLDSLDGQNANKYNEALCTARIQREARKCCSDVCLSKSSEHNFENSTDIDLIKYKNESPKGKDSLTQDQILEMAGERFLASLKNDSFTTFREKLPTIFTSTPIDTISTSGESIPCKRRKLQSGSNTPNEKFKILEPKKFKFTLCNPTTSFYFSPRTKSPRGDYSSFEEFTVRDKFTDSLEEDNSFEIVKIRKYEEGENLKRDDESKVNCSIRSDNFVKGDDYFKADNYVNAGNCVKADNCVKSDNYVRSENHLKSDNYVKVENSTKTYNLIKADNFITLNNSLETNNSGKEDSTKPDKSIKVNKSTKRDKSTKREKSTKVDNLAKRNNSLAKDNSPKKEIFKNDNFKSVRLNSDKEESDDKKNDSPNRRKSKNNTLKNGHLRQDSSRKSSKKNLEKDHIKNGGCENDLIVKDNLSLDEDTLILKDNLTAEDNVKHYLFSKDALLKDNLQEVNMSGSSSKTDVVEKFSSCFGTPMCTNEYSELLSENIKKIKIRKQEAEEEGDLINFDDIHTENCCLTKNLSNLTENEFVREEENLDDVDLELGRFRENLRCFSIRKPLNVIEECSSDQLQSSTSISSSKSRQKSPSRKMSNVCEDRVQKSSYFIAPSILNYPVSEIINEDSLENTR